MSDNIVVLLKSQDGCDLVRRQCAIIGIQMHTFRDLLDAEFDQAGKKRKTSLYEDFDRIFEEAESEGVD